MSTKLLLALGLILGAGSAACSKIPKDRSAIDAVDIRGTGDLAESDVADKIATAETPKFLGLFRGVAYDYEVYDESVLQRDLARIERYFQGHGFMDARARAGRVIRKNKRHVRVEIFVEAGPPTLNRRVTVEGLDSVPQPIAEAVRTAASNALPPEKRFDEDAYKAATIAVGRALTDRGYAYAKVERNVNIDVGAHTADYTFSTKPSIPATFGAITIVGLDPDGAGPLPQEIGEGPIRRAMDIKPGTPYSTKEIDSATQALLDLGVFSAVHIVPKVAGAGCIDAGQAAASRGQAPPVPATGTTPEDQAPCPPPEPVVPLTVELEPARLRNLKMGGGAEFDEIKTDLHLVTGWEHHNFLGGLRDFSIDATPGVVLYPIRLDNYKGPIIPLPEERFRMQLRQPGFLEARTTGFFRPEFNVFPLLVAPNPPANDPVVGYVEPKASIGADRSVKKLFVSLGYNIQGEDPFAYTQGLNSALRPILLSYPQLLTNFDFRDDAVHPHAGVYLGNNLQVAGGPFGGNAADVRVQPELRFYIPLGHRLTFAVRSSVGFLFPLGGYQEPKLTQQVKDGPIAPYIPCVPPAMPTAATKCPTSDTLVTEEQLQAQEKDIEVVYFRGFYSGGPNTNRGFPLRGIAPFGFVPFLSPATAAALTQNGCIPGAATYNPTACTIPIAGLSLWELSTELRIQISGPFATSIFCDSGDVSPNEFQLRLNRPHLSCGAGARYDTPVGPIRLDLGYRIESAQWLGHADDYAANKVDPTEGIQPRIGPLPLAIAIGIGEAF